MRVKLIGYSVCSYISENFQNERLISFNLISFSLTSSLLGCRAIAIIRKVDT